MSPSRKDPTHPQSPIHPAHSPIPNTPTFSPSLPPLSDLTDSAKRCRSTASLSISLPRRILFIRR
jgi:hypothetical protein